MNQLDLKKKVAMVLPYLQKAGLVEDPVPCTMADHLQRVVAAAGDRIKVAGDILQFDEYFVSDSELAIDSGLLEKRVVGENHGIEVLKALREIVATEDPFDQATLEPKIKALAESMGVKLGVCINALRIALTGKGTGLGIFDAFAILGRERSLSRIDCCLAMCG